MNSAGGDGCSSTCEVESGWKCSMAARRTSLCYSLNFFLLQRFYFPLRASEQPGSEDVWAVANVRSPRALSLSLLDTCNISPPSLLPPACNMSQIDKIQATFPGRSVRFFFARTNSSMSTPCSRHRVNSASVSPWCDTCQREGERGEGERKCVCERE